ADRDRLAALARHAALHLADARHADALALAVEERSSELAVINAIQRAIGERVEFQAIVDAVGDQLRGVFGSENLWIRLRDADGVKTRILYLVEHGIRHPPRNFTLRGVERRFSKELRAG